MLVGVGVFGLLAASLASFFLERGGREEPPNPELREIMERLERIERRLEMSPKVVRGEEESQ